MVAIADAHTMSEPCELDSLGPGTGFRLVPFRKFTGTFILTLHWSNTEPRDRLGTDLTLGTEAR